MKIKNSEQTLCKFLTSILVLVNTAESYAEIVTDGSLGTATELVGPNYSVTSDLGQLEGSNLFHSFINFNLANGDTATFSGPNSITNIVSRVTGGSDSNIDGNITSTIDGANFWLINPAGIIFGENAAINVTGSVHMSNSDYIVLSDGAKFDATNISNSRLTVADPIGFGFLSSNTSSLIASGSTLQVSAGNTLSLVGREMAMTNVNLGAEAGKINIASLTAGEVVLSDSGITLEDATLGSISLNNTNIITSGNNGGAIYIRGGHFVMDSASQIESNSTGDSAGQGISLNAIDIQIGGKIISGSSDSGQGGSITIDGDNFSLVKNGSIETLATGTADAGGISLTITDVLSLNGENTVIKSFATGTNTSGKISLSASDVILEKGAEVNTDTLFAGGIGNDISVNATNLLTISDSGSEVSSDVFSDSGSGGDVIINVGQLVVKDGGGISVRGFAAGEAGAVVIHADSVDVSTKGAINARVTNGAGGGLSITATDSVTVSDADSTIATDTFGTANSGDLNITAASLTLFNGGIVSSGTRRTNDVDASSGKAGDINITTTEDVTIRGSGQITKVGTGQIITLVSSIRATSKDPDLLLPDGSYGAGGDISIQARNLLISDGGKITSLATADGNAGSILVNLSGTGELDSGTIETSAITSSGGNVLIQADQTIYLRNSEITAEAYGVTVGDDGGNVTIDPKFIILNKGGIVARANVGNGGNITIGSEQMVSSIQSVVDASSQKGIDGEVLIESPMQDMSAAVVNLNTGYIDLSALLNSPCAVSAVKNKSSFTVKKQYQLTPAPNSYDVGRSSLKMVKNSIEQHQHLLALYKSQNFRTVNQDCM